MTNAVMPTQQSNALNKWKYRLTIQNDMSCMASDTQCVTEAKSRQLPIRDD